MKLGTFTAKLVQRLGAFDGDQVIDLQLAYQAMIQANGSDAVDRGVNFSFPDHMIDLLKGGKEYLQLVEECISYVRGNSSELKGKIIYSIEEITIEAPISNPSKIICVGLNYHDHIKEMNRDIPEYPVFFAKFNNTITGPYEPIPVSSDVTQKLDYEGELAFIIGKQAKKVQPSEALQYVAGFTVVNDISARDLQRRTSQWLQGKTLDGSLPMGPYMVTLDSINDPHSLEIIVQVNGEVRQSSNTNQLVFDVPYLVAYLSSLMTLEPGDIICTGTPGGVGDAEGKYLMVGDIVRVHIDAIGTIENKVQ